MIGRLVLRAILPFPAFIFFLMITVFAVIVQAGASVVIFSKWTAIDETACTAGDIDATGPSMAVVCNDTNYKTTEAEFIVAYMQNPRPIACSVNKLDQASCRLTAKAAE